jgi:hypothetical protein
VLITARKVLRYQLYQIQRRKIHAIDFHERQRANQEQQQAIRQEQRVWWQSILPSGIWLREINRP